MRELLIRPEIQSFESFGEFAKEAALCADDLILTNEYIYKPFIAHLNLGCQTLFQEKYGAGEPTDVMTDAILRDLSGKIFSRIIAVGGGTIIDIAKICALSDVSTVDEVFDNIPSLKREKPLYIVPTTCGTGSEVTGIAVINRTRLGAKVGFASPANYADRAVLIPELLSSLPYAVFATSSIDALIHATESFLTPTSTPSTELFAVEAIRLIVKGYMEIAEKGADSRFALSAQFLRANTYAGVAFSNNGTGAVHAMSYALGGKYHVAHGESNYQFFVDVLKAYRKKAPGNKLLWLEDYLRDLMGVSGDGFTALDELLEKVYHKKPMREYGVVNEDVEPFASSTVENQQRLLNNNYVPLTKEEIADIFLVRL